MSFLKKNTRPKKGALLAEIKEGLSALEVGFWLFLLLLVAGGYLYVALEEIRIAWLPSYCLLHEATGLLCPACGGTRALGELLQGNFALAFRYNPFFILLLPFFLYFFAAVSLLVWHPYRSLSQLYLRPLWIWLLLFLLLLFVITRNFPSLDYLGYPWQ